MSLGGCEFTSTNEETRYTCMISTSLHPRIRLSGHRLCGLCELDQVTQLCGLLAKCLPRPSNFSTQHARTMAHHCPTTARTPLSVFGDVQTLGLCVRCTLESPVADRADEEGGSPKHRTLYTSPVAMLRACTYKVLLDPR